MLLEAVGRLLSTAGGVTGFSNIWAIVIVFLTSGTGGFLISVGLKAIKAGFSGVVNSDLVIFTLLALSNLGDLSNRGDFDRVTTSLARLCLISILLEGV